MNKKFAIQLLMLSMSAASVQANTVAATDSSRVFDLDEVVVVSQPKEAFRLRRQPVSSSVFSDSELRTLGVRDLRELSSYVPSFVMPDYGSRLTSSMYIRGIGSRVNNPAVGMYVDGMPIASKNSYNFHTYQLERVDVLRGPQGTLYGMNTEGGLVRLYSKNPFHYQGTDVSIGLGSHLFRNVEAAHYSKASEKFALSAAGFYCGQNGFFRNATSGERADKFNEGGGKIRMMYNATSRLSLDYIADCQFVRQNGFAYGELDTNENTISAPAANRQSNYRRGMFNTGLDIRYDADRLTFNSNTSLQHLNDYMLMDQDYTAADFMHLEQQQLQNALTQEFSFKSNGSGIWRWTTGAYGSYQWLRTVAPVFFDADFTKRISANAPMQMDIEMSVPAIFHTPQYNIGVFHESNVRLLRRLTATIGLRYDYNRVKIHYDTKATMQATVTMRGQTITNTLASALDRSASDGYQQLLPKLGLSLDLGANGSNLYATVCKGYRAGGFNIQMFSDILQTELMDNYREIMRGDHEVPHTDEDYQNINNTISYKPEYSWNYELGAHLNLFGGKAQADIAAYYMQIRNQQLSVMAGNYGFGRMMVNAGKSHSLGLELALRGKALHERLAWAASYGLTRSQFNEYKDEENGQEIDYHGKRIPYIPMHTIGLSADYRQPLSGSVLRALSFGVNLSALGKIYWDEANTYSQSLYTLLGAHVDAELSHALSISLWAKNITNTHYSTFAFDSSASGKKMYFAQRGTPFQTGLSLKMHF